MKKKSATDNEMSGGKKSKNEEEKKINRNKNDDKKNEGEKRRDKINDGWVNIEYGPKTRLKHFFFALLLYNVNQKFLHTFMP